MTPHHWLLPALSAWLLLSSLAASSCASSGAADGVEREVPKPQAPGIVQVAEASRQFLQVAPATSGQGGAVLTVPARVAFKDGAVSRLGAPFAGRVTDIHVKTGDRVKAGDPLVTLGCPDAAAARTSLATASAALREAKLALERQRRLLDQGVGTERETVEAETRLASAQAEEARAQAASAFAGAGSGNTVVLRAPAAGTVLELRATRGASVEPGGEPLVDVGDPAALWVVAEVFERDLPLVHEGDPATVELSSLHEQLRGKVSSVGAVVAADLRTAPVRVTLDSTGEGLRPGMFGRVRIESPDAGLSLPTEAVLIKDGKESIVYVERDHTTFARRSVVVSRPVEGRVHVLSGLSPGEGVVVRGALLLDGAADQLL